MGIVAIYIGEIAAGLFITSARRQVGGTLAGHPAEGLVKTGIISRLAGASGAGPDALR